MLHVELYLKQIGIWLPPLFAVINLPTKALPVCKRSPQLLNICSWYDSNFSNPFDWFQEISSKGTSEIGLIYISNLSSRINGLLTAFDNSQRSDLRRLTARRTNIGFSSVPICFLLFADYNLVANDKGTGFRNRLTNQIAKWLNISVDLVNNMIFLQDSIVVKAEITITETSRDIILNSVGEFQMEMRKGTIAMADLWNNELQEAPVRIFQNEAGSFDKRESYHRRDVRSNDGVPVQLTFDADYRRTVRGREEMFKEHLRKQLAKTIRVPLSSIEDMNIRKDTVTADFVLTVTNDHNNVMDETTVQEAASDLQVRIHSGKLKVTDLDSNILQVVAVESTVKASSVSGTTDLTPIVLGVVLGVFLLMFVLVVLAAIIVQHVNKSCNRSVSPYGRKSTYKTFQNDDGRDSMNSIGKYSYDSGMWIGPGPEPKRKVPEAPLYRPPTVLQVRETPRPCTAVRVRLKDDWNIDPETTFGSKLEESLKE